MGRIERIGEATLYLGDCMEILPTLGKVDAVVTDPPYNAGVDYGDLTNDKREWTDWVHEMALIIDHLETISDGPVFMFASVRGMLRLSMVREPKWVCVWDKPMSFAHRVGGTPFIPHWEPCLVYGKLHGEGGRVPGWSLCDVWHHNTAVRNGHPCPKPISLILQLVSRIPSDLILDPFMGSGTTGVACARLGRKFIGVEIEERYFEIACRRIENEYKQPRLFSNDGGKKSEATNMTLFEEQSMGVV